MSIDTTSRQAFSLTAGSGAIHLPDHPNYDTARLPWNVAVDQRPAAVAEPRTADDVAAAVRSARRAGLRIAAQSTGHNAGPLAAQDLSDVMIIRTAALDEVTIDPEAALARVGAGSVWDSVVGAAGPHGLAALHGSSPDVSVVGYSLGGGLGWYARKFGMQATTASTEAGRPRLRYFGGRIGHRNTSSGLSISLPPPGARPNCTMAKLSRTGVGAGSPELHPGEVETDARGGCRPRRGRAWSTA